MFGKENINILRAIQKTGNKYISIKTADMVLKGKP